MTDHEIQTMAAAQGLYASVDKFGRYHLQLRDPPKEKLPDGAISLDPDEWCALRVAGGTNV